MLSGKVAVVTGAGRGIGAAAARLLAGQGARVLVNDLDREPAEKMAAELVAAGGEAIAVPGSVVEPGFADGLIGTCMERLGTPDVMVNNAGFLWDGMLHKMTDDQWGAVIECHMTAPFRLLRAAAPHMRDAAKAEIDKFGKPSDRSIVNVSSTSGLHGNVG